MSVGNQVQSPYIDQQITALAVQMRKVMQAAQDMSTWINGQGQGLAMLEAAGYDPADAALAQQMIAYMNTVAGCYFGTVQQGGSGGTGAAQFNFNQALSQVWAGQIA